jgi:predicted amidohydrolase
MRVPSMFALLILAGASVDWGVAADSASAAKAAPETGAAETKPPALRLAGIVLKWIRTDKQANFRRAAPMIRRAAAEGARIVVTTECFLDGYAIADKSIPLPTYRALGEPIPDGEYFKRLAALAGELKIHLVAGMLEADGERRYNTAVLIGPDGRLIGKYRKQKLGHELVRNTPGDESSVFETRFGRVGIMICADRRDEQVVRRFKHNGADLLICPSGGMFGPDKNDPILQARSRENRIPIIFVHPAEFLVTGPDGSILDRTVLGDRLLIAADQAGREADRNRVFYFDLAAAEDVPPRARQRAGVTLRKREKCDDGYRLYSSRGTETAHLIDLDGREVHRWSYPQGTTWHYAEMQPDGNLVAIVKDVMILELDWDSKLIWQAKLRAHHDFARLRNDHTLVVSRRPLTNPWTKSGKLTCDVLVELTPDKRAVWQWKVEEHAEEIARLVPLKIPPPERFGDWPHVNTIEVLPDGPAARKDPRFGAGNLLFCGRHIDTIGVIDRQTGKVVWAWGPGELLGPHMPTMLPNGHLLVYDNGCNRSVRVRGYTRVVELDPITEKIVWQYQADPPAHFFSRARGSNQRLPNGNTLIAESDPGRFFEVTPAGEMVWEFYTPDLNRNGSRMALYRTLSYPRDLVDRLVAQHQ